MHREISHSDESLQQGSHSALLLFTAFLGLLLLADLWPWAAAWLDGLGVAVPAWRNEVGGYRIALLVALLGGARALVGALESLWQGRYGADLALALAAVAAVLVREPLVAAEVVLVGLVGECLEGLTYERTRRAVRGLVEVCPRRCWRLRDGREERITVGELAAGDVVVVKPGGRVPADGVVLDGRSAVDVSPLTGESLPVDRGPGDAVLAGSLVQGGALTVEARRVAEDTVVGQVIALTARALRDKAPVERAADRLARFFLPAVLAVALVTFLGGLAIHAAGWSRPPEAPRLGLAAAARLATYPALSVLVVACPCALILATPAAVLAALGRLAGTGVLLKGGAALERLAAVDTVFFDKTGTLTEGRLELGDVLPEDGCSPEELLRAAATAEGPSEHPLARLIVRAARERGFEAEPVVEFLSYPGAGVSARTERSSLLVGSRALLEEQGVPIPPELAARLEGLDAAGQTVLLVCRDGRLLGAVGATDRVRPESAGVVIELRALGVRRLGMLTGDRPAVAARVAEAVGLTHQSDEVAAGLLPAGKAGRVERARAEGRTIVMVGDGVNDAPALAAADVGVAVGGGGSDVAAEAGDVVLMVAARPAGSGPLRSLPFLIRLSRETVRVIRQNILVFAFGVNGVGVLLTAWLWPLLTPASWYEHGPLAAALYHQAGSLAVLLNSLRILTFERGGPPGKWRRRAADLLDTRFDLDEALHWLAHRWAAFTASAAALLLAGYALSGLTVIGPDEVGVTRRFGRPLPDDLDPGLHWRWPWPVETTERVKPRLVRTLELGFRTVPGERGTPSDRGWASAHDSDGVRRVAEEAVVLAGDGNLLEVQGAVRYTVADPRAYLFGAGDPEGVLREAAEGVLRDVVAGRSTERLLTDGRADFQEEVRRRLAGRLGPLGLGLRVEGVALHDLHPPLEVVRDYHDVTRAMEARDRRVNEAEADALLRRRRQEASSLKTVREAEAEADGRVRLARARLAEFAARCRARSTLSWDEERNLFLAALGTPGHDYPRRRTEARSRRESAADFALFWDRVGAALAGRPKVVIDADGVPGRRHLWMTPVEIPAVPPVTAVLPKP